MGAGWVPGCGAVLRAGFFGGAFGSGLKDGLLTRGEEGCYNKETDVALRLLL